MSKFAFDVSRRLLGPQGFRHVFLSKSVVRRTPIVRVIYSGNTLGVARLGCVVPKALVPSAVLRNKIRRLIRESFRYEQFNIGSFDVVVHFIAPIKTISQKKDVLSDFYSFMRELFCQGCSK